MKYNVLFSCLMMVILASAVTACIQRRGSCDTQAPQDCCSGYCRAGKCINYGDDPNNDVGPNPCKDYQCPPGKKCSLHEVQCIRAPCHAIPGC